MPTIAILQRIRIDNRAEIEVGDRRMREAIAPLIIAADANITTTIIATCIEPGSKKRERIRRHIDIAADTMLRAGVILARKKCRAAKRGGNNGNFTAIAINTRGTDMRCRVIQIMAGKIEQDRTAIAIGAIGKQVALLRKILCSDTDRPALRPAYIHRAGIADHLAADHDFAIMLRDRRRLQFTAHRNQAIDDVAACRRRQRDFTAIRFNGAGIFNQLRLHVAGDSNLKQVIAVQIHRCRIARGKMHLTHIRGDDTVIDHTRRHHADKTSILRCNRTVIDNAGIRVSGLVERELAIGAVHERAVIDIRRTDDQPVHVDMRAGTKHHPVLVDDDDVPIRRQRAFNLACAGAVHTVERQRTRTRLVKRRRFIRRNVKAAPVDNGFIALLGDIKLVART